MSSAANGMKDAGSSHGHGPALEEHKRGLLLVGLFKLAKAVFFVALGAAALKLLHRNIGDLVMRITEAIPLDPQGKLSSMLMDRADLIDNHQLRMTGMLSLSYGMVCLVEGIGLLMRKVWAEYVTVVLTTGALPYEAYEFFREPSPWKAGLIAANVLVVLYLIWVVRRDIRNAK